MASAPDLPFRKLCLKTVVIFVAALAIRFFYLDALVIDRPIQSDAYKYFMTAKNIVEHGAYTYESVDDNPSTANFPPGYPLFLAAIIHLTTSIESFYWWTLNIQAGLGALTVVVIFLIGLRLLPVLGAVVAAMLTAIAPHQIVMNGYVLTETLFTFLLVCAIYVLIVAAQTHRLPYFVLFGGVIGLAALVRPAVLLFPLASAYLMWLGSSSRILVIKALALSVIGVIVFWAPWSAWKMLYAKPDPEELNRVAAQIALGSYPDMTHKNPKNRGFPYRDDPQYYEFSKSVSATLPIVWSRAGEAPGTYLKWYLIGKPTMFWSWDLVAGGRGPFIYHVKTSLFHQFRIAKWVFDTMRKVHPCILAVGFLTTIGLLIRTFKNPQVAPAQVGACALALLLIYYTAIHTVLAPLPRYSMSLHGPLYLLTVFGVIAAYHYFRPQVVRLGKHKD